MRYPIITTEGGATPLMYACQQCRENEVLEILTRQPLLAKERDRTLKSPLHYCSENVNNKCAEAILKVAPELINSQDIYGYCTLHLAIIAGNISLLKLLISKGADVNLYDDEGHSPVHWAVVSTESEALDEIIRAGADPSIPDIHGGYPLHYAVQMCGSNYEVTRGLSDAVRVVHKLLRYGVDVNVIDKDGRQPILWAASAGSAQIIKDLINNGAKIDASDKDGLTALHCAASRGHTETIETLVNQCGADVDIIDANGCSSLFYAVTLGHADATAMLLQLGAQPDRQDRKGRTPAHCGAAKGQLETLKLIEKFNGNLWLRNVRGDFPLHEAVASGRRDLVLWFLDKNPDAINVGNNDGRCPLHVAAMYNHVDMLKMLLESRCLVNPVMRSSKGVLMTPLNVALCKGHRSCAKLLQLHGGIPFSKVIKSDSQNEILSRISPSRSRPKKEKMILSDEIISPSFTVIKTSLGDESDPNEIHGERKKVYRRRKKRKSNDKKLDRAESDSEGNIQDERARISSSRDLKISSIKNVTINVKKRSGSGDDNEITSTGVIIDSPKSKKGLSSPDIKPAKGLENYDTNNQLDSEITGFGLKPVKVLIESDVNEKNRVFPELKIETIDDQVKSNRNESIGNEEASKKAMRDNNGEKISISSATAKDKKGEDNAEGKDDENKAETLSLGKDSPFEKNIKLTEKKSSKVTTVRKTEKTTKTVLKKVNKIETEEPIERSEESPGKKFTPGENLKVDFLEQKVENEKASFEVLKEEKDEDSMESKKSKETTFDFKDTNNIVVDHDYIETSDDHKNTEIDEKPEKKILIKKTLTTNEDLDTKILPSENKESNGKELVFAEIHGAASQTDSSNPEPKPLPSATSGSSKNIEQELSDNILNADDPAVEIDDRTGIKMHSIINSQENLNAKKTDSIGTGEIEQSKESLSHFKNSNSMPDLISLDEYIDDGQSNFVDRNPIASEIQLPSIVTATLPDSTFQARDDKKIEESLKHELPELSDPEQTRNQLKVSKNKRNKSNLRPEKPGTSSASADEYYEEFEPSPLNSSMKNLNQNQNNWLVRDGRLEGTFPNRIIRPCKKNSSDLQQSSQISINQFVQNAIRKYHLERGIFHQLLELKRLQIRAGRANEQLLVKRLVDEYERICAPLGTRHYGGAYKFKDLEKFLYDELRFINKGRLTLPEMKSYDDIDALSDILKKSRCELMTEVLPYEPRCACLTHRCHHSTKAYTTLPCSAYVAHIRRGKTSRRKKESFLPQICHYKSGKEKCENQLATLELLQGNDRQVIELPPTHRGKSKKYYITFTIESPQDFKDDDRSGYNEEFYKHRNAKSV